MKGKYNFMFLVLFTLNARKIRKFENKFNNNITTVITSNNNIIYVHQYFFFATQHFYYNSGITLSNQKNRFFKIVDKPDLL